MRLSIERRIYCHFATPRTGVVLMLRVTPQNSHDQTVARWRVHVDCDARLRETRDGWGNVVTMLYADGPLDELAIDVSGDVLTSHSDGVLHGVHEPLPPAVFRRATAATAPDPAIIEWAREAAGELEPLAALHRLNGELHRRLRIVEDSPAGTAAIAWQRAEATVHDAAQILAVAARGLGIPARCVSGYRATAEEAAPVTHGWVEAHVERLGWVGFDPTTGLSPQEDCVRVAMALDAAGAAPIAGAR